MKTKKILLLFSLLMLVLTILVSQTDKPFISFKDCTSCGECYSYCPVKAIEIIDGKAVIDYEKCINCKICVKVCTYGAIR